MHADDEAGEPEDVQGVARDDHDRRESRTRAEEVQREPDREERIAERPPARPGIAAEQPVLREQDDDLQRAQQALDEREGVDEHRAVRADASPRRRDGMACRAACVEPDASIIGEPRKPSPRPRTAGLPDARRKDGRFARRPPLR
jgi:hypothetical protein